MLGQHDDHNKCFMVDESVDEDEDSVWMSLGCMVGLKSLKLTCGGGEFGMQIKEDMISQIVNLECLHAEADCSLYIMGNPRCLSGMDKLTDLRITIGSDETDGSSVFVEHLPLSLKRLDLIIDRGEVSAEAWTRLKHMPGLIHLGLHGVTYPGNPAASGWGLGDNAIMMLNDLPLLESLDFDRALNPSIDREARFKSESLLLESLSRLTRLRRLGLSNNGIGLRRAMQQKLATIMLSMTDLEEIDLSGNALDPGDLCDMMGEWRKFNKLCRIDLRWNFTLASAMPDAKSSVEVMIDFDEATQPRAFRGV